MSHHTKTCERKSPPSRTVLVDPERNLAYFVLRPRDPDIQETNRPIVTEADLNNRLLQTTSSKELLAIMREIREKQATNSEAPDKSRRHLPSVPKPCGLGYQARPPLMTRFKALIRGLLGHTKRKRDCSGHVANICTSASRQRNDEARTSTFPAGPEPVPTQSQHLRIQQRPEEGSKGRRREAAILIQHMVRWRLTWGDVLAQIGTTMTGFDASNAFMSVLGTLLTYSCSNVAERRSVHSESTALFSAAWSGRHSGQGGRLLCPAVPIAWLSTSLPLQRDARWIDAEGKTRYHALTMAEVSRWLRLGPTHLELQIRRQRWWQGILMDREGNEALLGIFFCRLGAEVEGPLLDNGTLSPNAHPWALQLKVDLQSLRDTEPGRIHSRMGGKHEKAGYG